VQVLLDADYYALYTGANDVTQASADLATTKGMVAAIKGKFRSSVDELAKVLRCLDDGATGMATSACAHVRMLVSAGWARNQHVCAAS
jgi:hypothetical protein